MCAVLDGVLLRCSQCRSARGVKAVLLRSVCALTGGAAVQAPAQSSGGCVEAQVSVHTQIMNLCQAGLGLLQGHLNPLLFTQGWSCLPRVYQILAFWTGSSPTRCCDWAWWEQRILLCRHFLSFEAQTWPFPCAWELIDHALEERPGVRSSGSPSSSHAVLREALFHSLVGWAHRVGAANSEQVLSRAAHASPGAGICSSFPRFPDTSRPLEELVSVVIMANSHLSARVFFPNIWRVCLTSKSLVGKVKHVGGRGGRMCCCMDCVWLLPSLHRISWTLPYLWSPHLKLSSSCLKWFASCTEL